MDRDSIRRILEAKKRAIEAKIAASTANELNAAKREEPDLNNVFFPDGYSATCSSISSTKDLWNSQLHAKQLPDPIRMEDACGQGSSSSSEQLNSPESVPAPSRKRKSRWAPADSETAPCLPATPSIPAQSALQLTQLRVQLAAKEALLKVKAGVVESELGVPSLEHKTRAMEMAKTRELAAKLTVPLLQGGHHMQDFLPPEVMAKFQKKLEGSPTTGSASTTAQYEENKLDQSNVGYQMLKKFGWTEGKGLGSTGTGIAAPISSVTPVERAGLGTKRPDEPSAEDDEFELYRKRMMTAYKYRPNPLNNPRRPYY